MHLIEYNDGFQSVYSHTSCNYRGITCK